MPVKQDISTFQLKGNSIWMRKFLYILYFGHEQGFRQEYSRSEGRKVFQHLSHGKLEF